MSVLPAIDRDSAAGATLLDEAYAVARSALLQARHVEGCWEGRLCGSALATATAVSALSVVSRERFERLIEPGVRWLAGDQNPDGGWGDSPRSPSNVPASMLVHAALHLSGGGSAECRRRAARYLAREAGPSAGARVRTLRAIYGADRTFAAPILCNLALAGELGATRPEPGLLIRWSAVPRLPFELVCLPRALFGRLRLHVVSYALPALVAIGQLVHSRRPGGNPVVRALRSAARGHSFRLLGAIQPSSGGFIEAVPLTAFVVMSVAATGRAEAPVVRKGVSFLERLARPDGSWPIDSNLSVWLTTMAVSALSAGGRDFGPGAEATARWLLEQQEADVHPYTGARPGGWGWTHLPGRVPDVDDTSGALLALAALGGPGASRAAQGGLEWLLGVQNADGGWPTFCRGWGKLPFDRSAPDLTAHALRALAAWHSGGRRPERAARKGLAYLRRSQRADGAWVPLWFGDQDAPGLESPVYGTARVLSALRDLGATGDPMAQRGVGYLVGVQNQDGGWGGAEGIASSVEETALAVEALADRPDHPGAAAACARGAGSLARRVLDGALEQPKPMGLYFAQLWYSEKLYPVIWAVAALGRVRVGGRAAERRGRGRWEPS